MVDEIDNLKKMFMPVLLVFAVSFIFLMTFNIRKEHVMGINLVLPLPAIDSVSLSLFNKIQHDLLPKDMKILITNPINALLVQIDISLVFAFLVSLPILLYRVTSYLAPALRKHEKRLVVIFIVPSALLFLSGCVLGYLFLVPAILKLMNSYVILLNAATYFEINKFISFVLGFTFLSGVAFMLPVFMKLSGGIGIHRRFWGKNFKYALAVIVIMAFVVTPDIMTMVLVSAVLISLYALGYFLS